MLILKIKKIFKKLKTTFIIILILKYFNLELLIRIEINISSYIINNILS